MSRAVSKPQLARAIAAMEAAGKAVKGLLCQPDGSVAILTDAPLVPAVVAGDPDDWIDLAGDNAKTGPQRN